MKTIAFEATEQLSRYYRDRLPKDPVQEHTPWRAPDWYIQAVSGGLGPVGVIKGFAELKKLGLIDKIPKIGIIQAEGCSPMVSAWKEDARSATPISWATMWARVVLPRPGGP